MYYVQCLMLWLLFWRLLFQDIQASQHFLKSWNLVMASTLCVNRNNHFPLNMFVSCFREGGLSPEPWLSGQASVWLTTGPLCFNQVACHLHAHVGPWMHLLSLCPASWRVTWSWTSWHLTHIIWDSVHGCLSPWGSNGWKSGQGMTKWISIWLCWLALRELLYTTCFATDPPKALCPAPHGFHGCPLGRRPPEGGSVGGHLPGKARNLHFRPPWWASGNGTIRPLNASNF